MECLEPDALGPLLAGSKIFQKFDRFRYVHFIFRSGVKEAGVGTAAALRSSCRYAIATWLSTCSSVSWDCLTESVRQSPGSLIRLGRSKAWAGLHAFIQQSRFLMTCPIQR